MPSLRELQDRFAGALFSADAVPGLLNQCADAHPERGLAAYRRSVLANLAGAVRATYPVVEAIVGRPFLDAAIGEFVAEWPSTSGDLNDYGGEFADFLSGYDPAAGLPYLSDVARLEWQVQVIYGLADAPDQDLARLVATAPTHWCELRFDLDPAHSVLASDWPLARIWQINQPGYDGDFSIDFERAETVLIHRRPGGTTVEVLAPGEAPFLTALGRGATLGAAVDETAGQAGFDLQSALRRFIENGLLRRAY